MSEPRGIALFGHDLTDDCIIGFVEPRVRIQPAVNESLNDFAAVVGKMSPFFIPEKLIFYVGTKYGGIYPDIELHSFRFWQCLDYFSFAVALIELILKVAKVAGLRVAEQPIGELARFLISVESESLTG